MNKAQPIGSRTSPAIPQYTQPNTQAPPVKKTDQKSKENINALREANIPIEQQHFIYTKTKIILKNFTKEKSTLPHNSENSLLTSKSDPNTSEHHRKVAAYLTKIASSKKAEDASTEDTSTSVSPPSTATASVPTPTPSDTFKIAKTAPSSITPSKVEKSDIHKELSAKERMDKALNPSDEFKDIYKKLKNNQVSTKPAGAGVNGAQFVLIDGVKKAVIKPIQPKEGILRKLEIWGKAALKLDRPANYIGPPEFKGINEEAFYGLACIMGFNDPPNGPVPETRMILYKGQYYTMQLFAEGTIAKDTKVKHPDFWVDPTKKTSQKETDDDQKETDDDQKKTDDESLQQAQNASSSDLVCNQLDRHQENFLVATDEQGNFKGLNLIDSGACLVHKHLKAGKRSKMIRKNMNQWKDMAVMQKRLTGKTRDNFKEMDIGTCQEYFNALKNKYDLRMFNYKKNLSEKYNTPVSKKLEKQHQSVRSFFKGVESFKPDQPLEQHHIAETTIQKKLRILQNNMNIYKELAKDPKMTPSEMAKRTVTEREKEKILLKNQG